MKVSTLLAFTRVSSGKILRTSGCERYLKASVNAADHRGQKRKPNTHPRLDKRIPVLLCAKSLSTRVVSPVLAKLVDTNRLPILRHWD